MDRHSENIETDSTVDHILGLGQMDTSDSEIELCAHAWAIDAGQLLAGRTDAVAVGPRTDADARQAADPNVVGRLAVTFAPRDDPAANPPSSAAEDSATWHGTTHSMPYPTEVAYYGPHPRHPEPRMQARVVRWEVTWDASWDQAHLGQGLREQSHQIVVKLLLRQRVPEQAKPLLSLPRM